MSNHLHTTYTIIVIIISVCVGQYHPEWYSWREKSICNPAIIVIQSPTSFFILHASSSSTSSSSSSSSSLKSSDPWIYNKKIDDDAWYKKRSNDAKEDGELWKYIYNWHYNIRQKSKCWCTVYILYNDYNIILYIYI